MKTKMKSLRWVLLAAGIIVVVGLTAMNVYSLYTLRNSSLETARQSNKIQIAEFADRIRYRFFEAFDGMRSVDMDTLETVLRKSGQLTEQANELIYRASQDSIFADIYFIPASSDACTNNAVIQKYNPEVKKFEPKRDYPSTVCDGLGIARTRMNALIEEYQYTNKVIFDTHRSMVIALVNQNTQGLIGYLAMPINREFMVKDYLQPKLVEAFGPNTNSVLNVWLRNWTNGQVIASSEAGVRFDPDKIEYEQQFPDLFDDWRLYAAINAGAGITAARPSMWTNMIALAAAFIFLVGAMLFMFFTAQKERALAERQSDFLSNVTHELKTPLSVMQAAGENLADGRVDNRERLESYGAHIYSEAVRLRKMIDRLLDVAKADAGDSFIHPKPVAVHHKVKAFIEEHRSYIKDKGFNLQTSVPEHLPYVMADEHSIETILSNLVNNAIKYSNESKFISINLSKKGKDIILRVEDRGIGMSKNSIGHIFEKFYRVEDPLTAETKGYGLGLSIVKNLVELNGGSISVNSREGHGSTFTVTFPVIQETKKAADRSLERSSSNKLARSTH